MDKQEFQMTRLELVSFFSCSVLKMKKDGNKKNGKDYNLLKLKLACWLNENKNV